MHISTVIWWAWGLLTTLLAIASCYGGWQIAGGVRPSQVRYVKLLIRWMPSAAVLCAALPVIALATS